MKRLFAGIVAVGTLAAGGTIAVDKSIDPYQSVGTNLEIIASSTLAEAGTDKIIVDTLQPKITLSKFNGELQMGVTYQCLNSQGGRPLLSKNVTWTQDPTQSMEAVPLEASSTFEDGGVELNVILNQAPASNVFNFSISDYQNLDFFFQAPLWQGAGLEAPTKDCTDTDCTTDGEIAHRATNVVGSYAVYYKNHADHLEGQTNYGTGKMYQIFRPLVTDAKGNTVWADMSYTTGVLSVTVPQSFLDTATYPVKIDPTFGTTGIGGTSVNIFSGDEIDSGHTMTPATSGTVTQISYYLSNAAGAITLNTLGALYLVSSLAPLGSGAQVNVNSGTPQFWNSTGMSVSVTAGVGYYISEFCDCSTGSGINAFFDTVGAANRIFDQAAVFPTLTNPAATVSSAREYSFFATYAASGGSTATHANVTTPKGTETLTKGITTVN